MAKTILGRYGNDRQHWVGDGFPVRSIVGYGPFVMSSEAAIRQAIEAFNNGRFTAAAA